MADVETPATDVIATLPAEQPQAEKPGSPTLATLRDDIKADAKLSDPDKAAALAAIDALIAEVGTAALDAGTLEGLRSRAGSLSAEAVAAISGLVDARLVEYTNLQTTLKSMSEEKKEPVVAEAAPAAKEAIAEKTEAPSADLAAVLAALSAKEPKAAEAGKTEEPVQVAAGTDTIPFSDRFPPKAPVEKGKSGGMSRAG